MLKAIGECYRTSGRLALTLPLLLALPALAELSQHIVEYRLGMFESIAAARAVENHPLRLAYGLVKIVSLFLLIYWVSRALAFGRGGLKPIVGDARSAALFLRVVLLNLAIGMVQLFGPDASAPLLGEGASQALRAALFVLGIPLSIYLTVWAVGSALGNEALTIKASFRILHGSFWWSLGFLIVMQLPLLAVHYALNFAANGQGFAALWLLLGLDSLLVGYLGVVIGATHFAIARRAAERKGVSLC